MSKRTEDMGKRYNELRESGMSGKDAAEQVNREFKTKLTAGTIRGYGVQTKKRSESGEPGQENTTTEPLGDTTDTNTESAPHYTDRVVNSTESLKDDEVTILRKIIEWWTAGGEQTAERLTSVNVEDLVTRPAFPNDKVNSGIRIDGKLFKRAVEKCKTKEEARKTGGSLSGLIEVLLWGYLGNDSEYLKEDPEFKKPKSEPV